jgi:hypothetical protein
MRPRAGNRTFRSADAVHPARGLAAAPHPPFRMTPRLLPAACDIGTGADLFVIKPSLSLSS